MKAQNRKLLKKTPWYSGCNPLRSRPGWYEVKATFLVSKNTFMRYWDGETWCYSPFEHPLYIQDRIWRGVSR